MRRRIFRQQRRHIGVIADRKAVPHLQDLADALESAFLEARGVFTLAEAPKAPKVARKRAKVVA